MTGSRAEKGARMVKPLHSVIDKVYRRANLERASAKVCANKGAAGVDRVTVRVWRAREEAHLRQLHAELYADTYRSQPVAPGVHTQTWYEQATTAWYTRAGGQDMPAGSTPSNPADL